MKQQLEFIKQALEEHLSAINDNSSEIQALFDYLHQLETKVELLSQRLDSLQLQGQPLVERHTVKSLNHIEKKVFLILYTETTPVTFSEIAAKIDMPLSLVPECVSSLVQKGVPLCRTYFNDQLFIALDVKFKELQAKENVVNLSLQSFME